MSGEKVNENYREYLKAYTRHYNRNKETYGGRKITEGEAEDHATVREVKSYYEEMEGRQKQRDQSAKEKLLSKLQVFDHNGKQRIERKCK